MKFDGSDYLNVKNAKNDLNFNIINSFQVIYAVAPYMGAWIEINGKVAWRQTLDGRSLHGSVD